MRRGMKIVGWVAGVVALLLVIATLAIKLYLTRDRVMGWVVPPLEARLHRTVTIADVSAGLTGLSLDGIEIRAADAVEPLLATRRVQVGWNLWALLGGTVEIAEVRLVEPRIHVTRLPDGALDVDDLTTAPEAPAGDLAAAPSVEPPAPAEPAGGPPMAVVVRLFSLQGGRVTLLDQSVEPATAYVLGGIDARLTEMTLDGPIPFELSADLPLAVAARFTSQGTVNLATQAVDATLAVNAFELAALTPLLGGGTTIATGVLGVQLTVTRDAAGAIAAVGGLRVTGLSLAAGENRGATADLSLELDVIADLSEQSAEVRALTLQAAEQTLTGSAAASAWGTRPQVDFQLHSEELRVDRLLALLPPADGAAPDADPAPPPQAPEPQDAGAPGALPLGVEGQVTVGLLRHGDIRVEDLAVRLVLKDDRLQVDPLTAELYGGTLEAKAGADLTSPGPAFQAEAQARQVQLGKLLGDLSPTLKDALTGTAMVELTAAGVGGDLKALVSHAKLTVRDGKLVDHPLVQTFTELFQVKEYRTLNFYDLLAEVGTGGGVATVTSLIFRGPNLQATGKGTVTLVDPEMDLLLAVALPREVADKLVNRGEVLDTLTDKEGWTRLPLRLEGSPEAPRYGLDAVALEKVAAKALEKKAQQVLQDKVLKDVPMDEATKSRLDQGMKSLFGR